MTDTWIILVWTKRTHGAHDKEWEVNVIQGANAEYVFMKASAKGYFKGAKKLQIERT